MNINEMKIDAPWGHLAAKVWGDLSDPIILMFHGIMDNAGSFDRLIPLLPKSFCYVCVDFPGHGKSSHFPPILPLVSINNILAYRIVASYFKKEKYIIIGHSYGGQLGLLFAQIYPEYVEKLIMLDSVYLFPVHSGHFATYLRDKFEFTLYLPEKLKQKSKPTYTYSEAFERIKEGRRNGYITSEAAQTLLPRSLKATEDGKFEFTMDQRLKEFVNPLHDFPYIFDTFKRSPVNCPVLILLGRESDLQQTYFKSLINFFKKKKNFVIKVVEGHHDVHNNKPEVVAPHVTRFILGKKAKL